MLIAGPIARGRAHGQPAALAKRPGRLFIDYLRNGRGTTAIGAYSPRALPGFPWPDIETLVDHATDIQIRGLSRSVHADQGATA